MTTLVLIKTNRVGRPDAPIDVTCAENAKIFAMFVYSILKLFLHNLGQMMPLSGQGLNMMNRDKRGTQWTMGVMSDVGWNEGSLLVLTLNTTQHCVCITKIHRNWKHSCSFSVN